jgi:hypothetical protein
MQSTALAGQDMAAAQSPSAPACITHRLKATPGVEKLLSVSALTARLRGMEVHGLRIIEETPRGFSGVRTLSYEDHLAVQSGRVELELIAVGIPHPFPTAVERQLLSLLYIRAKAHKL